MIDDKFEPRMNANEHESIEAAARFEMRDLGWSEGEKQLLPVVGFFAPACDWGFPFSRSPCPSRIYANRLHCRP
jgi:hypothetical protein